jgi:hypothetical protein
VKIMRHAFDMYGSHAGTASPLGESRESRKPRDSHITHITGHGLRPVPLWLRDSILDAYRRDCVYITRAVRDTSSPSELVTLADVHVPKTFYGDQTGHFNAVEAVLCVNQIAFLTIADFVIDPAPHEFRAVIRTSDLATFKDSVLSRTFITSSSMKFRRTLDGHAVTMRFRFAKPRRRGSTIFLAANYVFSQRDGPHAASPAFSGEATFAIPVM